MDEFKLILVSLGGWLNRQQQHVIECLQEEIRILEEQAGESTAENQGLGFLRHPRVHMILALS